MINALTRTASSNSTTQRDATGRLVPPCWRQHQELVEELSALHLAWEGSFGLTAAHDAPLLWHERFAKARARIGDGVARTGCRPGGHRGGRL